MFGTISSSKCLLKKTSSSSCFTKSTLSGLRRLSTLVIGEHSSDAVTAGTLSAITAAEKIATGEISLLLIAKDGKAVAESARKIKALSKVLLVEDSQLANPTAESYSHIVQKVMSLSGNYTHILAPSSNHGKSFMPRVAALQDTALVTDVIAVMDRDTFKRPMYAGNAIATVQTTDSKKFLLIRPTAFDKADQSVGSAPVDHLKLDLSDIPQITKYVSSNQTKSARPELTSARVVVSGGRGMKNGENFKMLEELADKLNGAVGASRAAVDAGFVPNDYQVGQTGKVVAPDLYIAVGISGAIQHLSGMKDSKTIVAINKDKDAPIFQIADYGLVEDLFVAVPDLTAKL